MKSIDTFYNGNYYRSRLEARWAVFFENLGIKYQYEPEGFKNEKGECYLPDFYLPDTYLRSKLKGVYIEIKPDSYELSEVKCSEWFEKPLVLFKGNPDKNIWGGDNRGDGGYECWKYQWDNNMLFWVCQECGTTKIEFAGGSYDYCPKCKGNCNEIELGTDSFLANMKRFEHNFKTQ